MERSQTLKNLTQQIFQYHRPAQFLLKISIAFLYLFLGDFMNKGTKQAVAPTKATGEGVISVVPLSNFLVLLRKQPAINVAAPNTKMVVLVLERRLPSFKSFILRGLAESLFTKFL